MGDSIYKPVISNEEFSSLYHGMGDVEIQLKELSNQFNTLNEKKDLSDGELDWLLIKEAQLKNIFKHVYTQLVDIKGEEYVFNLTEKQDQDKRIQDLWNKVHDQRQLGIQNDSILQELYEVIAHEKRNAGR